MHGAAQRMHRTHGAQSERDSWLDALAKLIPGEAIVAFTAAIRVPGPGTAWVVHAAVLLGLTAIVPLSLWSSARHGGTSAPALQYAVRGAVVVLYGFGCDDMLWQAQDAPLWIPQIGALLVPVLAALVLCPPGAQCPPPADVSRPRATS